MQLTRSRNVAVALGALLLTYLSWQLLHWLPGHQQLGQLFLPLFDLIAITAAWGASRRCAPVPRLRKFWRLIAAAIAAELIADVILSGYDIGYSHPPFPTPADAFFLSYFALLLVALLSIPVAHMTLAARLRMSLDGWTIVLGGGAVVWYFVLGPTVLSTGEGLLAKTVSMAYPLFDLVLLGAVAVVLLRRSPATLRLPLLWIAAAMLLTVVADTVYGIFERFNQVDASDAREKGGSGLGLAIARGIVESHGGHLWAESAPGEGSSFCFTLPLAGAGAPCSSGVPTPEELSAGLQAALV